MFTNIKKFVSNSFFMENIDTLAFVVLLMLLISAVFASSDVMGLISLMFSFLILFKKIFSIKTAKFQFLSYEKIFFVYFLIVTLSLCASSLFSLSLHGYIKTLIYVLFFYCVSDFFKENANKFSYIIYLVIGLMSYESIIAIIQNLGGVVEISGWQDMTNINPEQVVSRAYGTLLPYNPNLLAGYLLCGLGCFVYAILTNLKDGKKRLSLIFLALFLMNLIAIIDTGCRGAYLGFLFFFPILFIALVYYVHKNFGGLNNIKKRYKNLLEEQLDEVEKLDIEH